MRQHAKEPLVSFVVYTEILKLFDTTRNLVLRRQ